MADTKISALTATTTPLLTDILPIVTDPGGTPVTKKVTVGNLLNSILTGWFSDGTTWEYVSASTFRISGDYTTTYQKGTYLKWVQTTTKYGVVVSSAYSAPYTTVTIIVNTDYTVANAAISGNFFSYGVNPQGWVGWFSYTPSIFYGFSANPTVSVSRYNVVNKICHIVHAESVDGTSNATAFGFALPVTAAAVGTGSPWTGTVGYSRDNTAENTTGARWAIAASGSVCNLYKTLGTASWTNSGGKRAFLECVYEW